MCGITVNSNQEGGGNDGKINDLKLRDGTRATMVSKVGVGKNRETGKKMCIYGITICLIMMLNTQKIL